jgi:phage tail-like protein
MSPAAAANPGVRTDPIPVYKFAVALGSGGTPTAVFNECSGLEMTVEFDPVTEGGQNEYQLKLPKGVKYGNLVLKRGYAVDQVLMNWCLEMRNRTGITRRDVTVSLIKLSSQETLFSWTFTGAFPVKWSGPALKAGDNSISIETLELAHSGLQTT